MHSRTERDKEEDRRYEKARVMKVLVNQNKNKGKVKCKNKKYLQVNKYISNSPRPAKFWQEKCFHKEISTWPC